MITERDKPKSAGRRAGLAAVLGAWVGGGLLVVIVLAFAGLLGGGETTTAIKEAAASGGSGSEDSGAAEATSAEALYAKVAAGVVEIKAEVTQSGGEGAISPFGPPQPESESSPATAAGSGFLVDQEGTVVTAAHVVEDTTSVTVTMQDGTTRGAEVLGEDEATDIAVLRFDATGLDLEPLELGSSSSLNVGAWVAAIGAPFEYAGSFSTGVVSGLDRAIEAPNGFTVAHAIQTDAAVNPGNSGGPLLGSDGRVVGVVDQIATNSGADQSSGVGFAVPSDLVASELDELERGEVVEHAYLGVVTSTSSTERSAGAEVVEVVSGSPAAGGDVQRGDLIIALDEEPIDGTDDLVAAIAEHDPGEKVVLDIERGSESFALELRLGTQPQESSQG